MKNERNMSNTLLIRDETFQGTCIRQQELSLEGEKASVREIIAAKVMAEVELYNRKARALHAGLWKVSAQVAQVDVEAQIALAWEAFQTRAFYVLINSIEALSLDEIVPLRRNLVVSFLK
ncbi:MAG: hypothetical protein AAGM67_01065 [Bacteroidota bacterium]